MLLNLVPGSQRTVFKIVKGKDDQQNTDSFCFRSLSHSHLTLLYRADGRTLSYPFLCVCDLDPFPFVLFCAVHFLGGKRGLRLSCSLSAEEEIAYRTACGPVCALLQTVLSGCVLYL